MKHVFVTVLSLLSITTTAAAAESQVLSVDQAKAIAVIQARGLNVNDDVLSVVNTELEPVYSVASIEHVGSEYKVSVNRMAPGESCQQKIAVNDTTGKLTKKSAPKCE